MLNKYIIVLKGCAFAGILVLGLVPAKAQDNGDGVKPQTVVSVKDIKVHLADAMKIDVLPVQENIRQTKPEMTYTTDPFLVPSPTFKTKLQAFSINGPGKLPALQKSFVKGSIGNYSDLYGEIFYNTLRNRTDLFSVDLKHKSGDANGQIQSGELKGTTVKNSGFSTNAVDLFGSHIFDGKYDLTASMGYRRDANHFYAIIPDSLKPNNVSDYQAFNDFHVRANLENTGADTGKLRYNIGVGYCTFGDNYKTTENDILVSVKMDEPLKDNHIRLDASFDYMPYQNLEYKLSRTLLKINLGYALKTGIIRAYLGFKTASEGADTGNAVFHFYPDIKVEADLIEKYLTIFGGLTGNLDKNTYRSFAYENPFIVSDPRLRNTNDKFDIFGGAKGSFSSNSSFLLTVAYKNYHNLYFYQQDTVDRRKFAPVYDTGTTTLINVHAELAWSFMENLNLNTKVDLNNYMPSTLKHPYERPGFEWMLTGNYNLDSKITFGADVFFVGERFATNLPDKKRPLTVNEVRLKPYVDVNAHVSYAFENVKGLKAFIELNNIFGNQYQVWNNYPVRGFQILGGAMFSFL
jgi:hypothetical protein